MTPSRSYIGTPDTDHNKVNRVLREETDRMGGNPYYKLFKKAMYTKTQKERVEEVVYDLLSDLIPMSNCGCGGYLPDDNIGIVRTTLLTLRREWLEEMVKERVKKMEIEQKEYKDGNDYEDGYWDALQNLIDADRKELEELTN